MREPTAQEMTELGLREEEIVEMPADKDNPFFSCTITYVDEGIKVESDAVDVTRQYKEWVASLPRKRRFVTDWSAS